MSSVTRRARARRDRAHVETEVLEWIERYLQVESMLELDSAAWQSPFTVAAANFAAFEMPRSSQTMCARHGSSGIDPIPNMTELLEEKGLKVLIVSPAGSRFRIHLPR